MKLTLDVQNIDRIKSLSKDLNISVDDTISFILIDYFDLSEELLSFNLNRKKVGRNPVELDLEDFRKSRFVDGLSYRELSKKYNIGVGTVCKYIKEAIKEYGVDELTKDIRYGLSDDVIYDICRLNIENKLSINKISSLFDIEYHRVKFIVNNYKDRYNDYKPTN